MTWELFIGDWKDRIASVPPDAYVITDPPYGVSERCDRLTKRRSNLAECHDFPQIIGDDQPFDPTPFLAFPSVILWGANHFADRLPISPTWLVWDKRDGIPSNDNADCEIAWSNLGGPARLFAHRWSGMIKASEHGENRVHPTQKPIDLMRWCIRTAKIPEGATIFDPFAGSGPVGIAATMANINYIGCEIVPEYGLAARKRIAAADPCGKQQRLAI